MFCSYVFRENQERWDANNFSAIGIRAHSDLGEFALVYAREIHTARRGGYGLCQTAPGFTQIKQPHKTFLIRKLILKNRLNGTIIKRGGL